MVYTLNIYHFRTINMYETFHIVCVIFITWAHKENLRKLITIYLIVFLYVQTYWIYLGEIGSHQDIFHFTKIKSISPRFFRFHQESADFTKWEFHQESHQVRLTRLLSMQHYQNQQARAFGSCYYLKYFQQGSMKGPPHLVRLLVKYFSPSAQDSWWNRKTLGEMLRILVKFEITWWNWISPR